MSASIILLPLRSWASPPPSPGRQEVCTIVTSMPNAEETDPLLTLLETTRAATIDNLEALKFLMQRLDAEKYGWQNILGGDTLEVQLQPWLIGALRMACEGTTASRQATVSGTVTYSQRVALPPDAVVEVQLVDISLADAPAIVIDQQTIKTDGQQVPIPFTLSYNPANIDPRHRYAVQARILFEGQLRWISTTSYLVLTQGNPSTIEVVVDPVAL